MILFILTALIVSIETKPLTKAGIETDVNFQVSTELSSPFRKTKPFVQEEQIIKTNLNSLESQMKSENIRIRRQTSGNSNFLGCTNKSHYLEVAQEGAIEQHTINCGLSTI